MFEDSLFASQHHHVSPRTRWTAAASVMLQMAAAALVVALPLLHTGVLPAPGALRMTLPLTAPPPPPPRRPLVQRPTTATASALPTMGRVMTAPPSLPTHIDTSAQPDPGPVSFAAMGSSMAPGVLPGMGGAEPGRVAVRIAPERTTGPVRISAGVSTGMLLTPIRPVYPAIAKAARMEGTVVVEAVISRSGTIESLHVISGSPMLQGAALEAIRGARYQPFQLNGQPIEVQTVITVNFKLGA